MSTTVPLHEPAVDIVNSSARKRTRCGIMDGTHCATRRSKLMDTAPPSLQCTACGTTVTRDMVYCPNCEFPSIHHVDHSKPAEFRHIPSGGPGAAGQLM